MFCHLYATSTWILGEYENFSHQLRAKFRSSIVVFSTSLYASLSLSRFLSLILTCLIFFQIYLTFFLLLQKLQRSRILKLLPVTVSPATTTNNIRFLRNTIDSTSGNLANRISYTIWSVLSYFHFIFEENQIVGFFFYCLCLTLLQPCFISFDLNLETNPVL